MENKKNYTPIIITLGIIIFVILVGVYYIGKGINSPVASSDVTVYPVQCDDWFSQSNDPNSYASQMKGLDDGTNRNEPEGEARNFQNCLKRRALSRISLKIDKANQQVIKWDIDNGGTPAFSKSIDCTIVDSNNWSCDNKSSYPFGFNDGSYFESDFTHVIFVSKTQWNSINNGAPTPLGADVPSK
jgi:hypothetical protein